MSHPVPIAATLTALEAAYVAVGYHRRAAAIASLRRSVSAGQVLPAEYQATLRARLRRLGS